MTVNSHQIARRLINAYGKDSARVAIQSLSTVPEAIPEHVFQVGGCIDLADCVLKRIFHPSEIDRIVIQNDITRLGIAISRLPYAPHIDHRLVTDKLILVVALVGT